MWLLKLHFSISVLCLLSVIGMKIAFKEQFKRFPVKKREKLRRYLIYFCPITNLLLVVTACYLAFCGDDTAEKISERIEAESDQKGA